MKHVGRPAICLAMVVVFCYLMLFDYPAMMKRLSLKSGDRDTADSSADVSLLVDSSAESSSQEDEDDEEKVAEDKRYTRSDVPQTQTILMVGSIRERVYDEFNAVFEDAGQTATMLFFEQHLTGDYGQLETPDFLELVDNDWGYAIGGVDDDLDDDDWQDALAENVNRVLRRSGVSPSVYFFQEGELTADRIAALEDEDFSAYFYSAEDSSVAENDDSTLRAICCLSFADLDEDAELLSALLDEAWEYDSVAFYNVIDTDTSYSAGHWQNLLAALANDDRFAVTSLQDWLDNDLQVTEDRADMVASVLEAEAG